jgi:hypothetical protein
MRVSGLRHRFDGGHCWARTNDLLLIRHKVYGLDALLAPLYKCRQIKELVLSRLYKSRLLFAVLRPLSLDTV